MQEEAMQLVVAEKETHRSDKILIVVRRYRVRRPLRRMPNGTGRSHRGSCDDD